MVGVDSWVRNSSREGRCDCGDSGGGDDGYGDGDGDGGGGGSGGSAAKLDK